MVHGLDGASLVDLIVLHQLGARMVARWGPLRAACWLSARTELELPMGRASGAAAVGDRNGASHIDLAHPACENGCMALQSTRSREPLCGPRQPEQGTEPRGKAITDWDHDGRANLAPSGCLGTWSCSEAPSKASRPRWSSARPRGRSP